jgi:hypothetical protein
MAWAANSTAYCTGLINTPGSTFSCGVSRIFNSTGSFLYARPVPGAGPYDANADGDFNDLGDVSVGYHFRITGVTNPGYVKDAWMTNYILPLVWSTDPMTPGVYNVQVRTQLGGVWQPFCGSTCQVTIIPSGPMQGGNDRTTEVEPGTADLALWPNPNRGDKLHLTVDQLDGTLTTATLDVYDLFGKRVATYPLPVGDGVINTTLDLNGTIATGMYLVTVTAGEQLFTKRLVID